MLPMLSVQCNFLHYHVITTMVLPYVLHSPFYLDKRPQLIPSLPYYKHQFSCAIRTHKCARKSLVMRAVTLHGRHHRIRTPYHALALTVIVIMECDPPPDLCTHTSWVSHLRSRGLSHGSHTVTLCPYEALRL